MAALHNDYFRSWQNTEYVYLYNNLNNFQFLHSKIFAASVDRQIDIFFIVYWYISNAEPNDYSFGIETSL